MHARKVQLFDNYPTLIITVTKYKLYSPMDPTTETESHPSALPLAISAGGKQETSPHPLMDPGVKVFDEGHQIRSKDYQGLYGNLREGMALIHLCIGTVFSAAAATAPALLVAKPQYVWCQGV